MKKTIVVFLCLWLFIIGANSASGKDVASVKTLPPIVAQTYGFAGTIIMWHDIDGDGKADYKATYIFKEGRLRQVSKVMISQE
jgi:hypothetical protein